MIYTVTFKNRKIAKGKDNTENEKGDIVFRNLPAAKKFIKDHSLEDQYWIYEIDADWNNDTIPYSDSYNFLIRNYPIGKRML